MKVKDFLKEWNGNFNIKDEDGYIYTSFKENIATKIENQEILDIKLINKSINGKIDIIIKKLNPINIKNKILCNPELYQFKGKRKDNNEWVDGYLWNGNNISLIIPHNTGVGYDNKTNSISAGVYEVDKSTICRPTGFYSSPKRHACSSHIWEYDIIRIVNDGEEHTYIVVWDEDEKDFKATNGRENYGKSFCYLSNAEEIEILGNVFDNKELLKHIE